jgi:L-threonylcarbamoyladenylate synthase
MKDRQSFMSEPRFVQKQKAAAGSPAGGAMGHEAAARVSECVNGGGVVLMPTDTVYGLAVHPMQDGAIERLFAMKGRPRSRNLPIMVSSEEEIRNLGGVICEPAARLIDSRWFPGPLTLALGICRQKAPAWLAEREEAAFRMPDDAFLLAVLRLTGPLLMTSANFHAEDPRESVAAILSSLAGEPDLVVDRGDRATVPSTLVNCRAVPPVIERVGVVPTAEIEALIR